MTGPIIHGRTHRPGGTDPIPGLTLGDGGGFPFLLPWTPPGAVVPGYSVSPQKGIRRMPGGVVIVPAHPFVDGGTVIDNTERNSLCKESAGNDYKVVRHNQSLGAPTGGTVTLSIPRDDVPIYAGLKYDVFVSFRVSANTQARFHLTKDGGWNDTTFTGATARTCNRFGFCVLDESMTFAGGGDLELKAGYVTGQTAANVDVDYLIFVPSGHNTAGVVPEGIGEGWPGLPYNAPGAWSTYFIFAGLTGPNASFVTTDFESGLAGGAYTDPSFIRGVLDPDFDWTFGDMFTGNGQWETFDSYYNVNTIWPRHIYVLARLREAAGSPEAAVENIGGTCFATWGHNGVPQRSATLLAQSWHMLYLGPAAIASGTDSGHLGIWTAENDGDDARSPFGNSAGSGYVDPIVDLKFMACSSFYDFVETLS